MLNTELSVVNDMLGLLGEAPVNDLDSFHPMVPRALQTLRTTSGNLQGNRWWFNTEVIELVPQADTGHIMLPVDTLSVDPITKLPRTTQRGSRLYNLDDNSFVFTTNVTCELRRDIPFDDLPNTARAAIAAQAQLAFQNPIDGDAGKTRNLQTTFRDALMQLNAEHTRNVKANMLRRPGVLDAMHGIGGRRAPFYR